MTPRDKISLQAALDAQKALREAAKLGEETFTFEAFVGMVSDEIEQLRKMGHTDEQIALIIRDHSAVRITADEITAHYVSPEQRNQHVR